MICESDVLVPRSDTQPKFKIMDQELIRQLQKGIDQVCKEAVQELARKVMKGEMPETTIDIILTKRNLLQKELVDALTKPVKD